MVILVTIVRITPSKWDAEYCWLTDERCNRSIGTSPMLRVDGRKGHHERWSWGRLRRTLLSRTQIMERRGWWTLGLGLQACGAMVLLAVGIDSFIPAISLGAVLGGEIIFISSLGHRGLGS